MALSTAFRGPTRAESAGPGPASLGTACVRTGQLLELILKDRRSLERLLFATPNKLELAARLLAISLGSFVLFGVAMSLACDASGLWPHLTPTATWLADPSREFIAYLPVAGGGRFLESWSTGRAEHLVIAYAFGLIAASGVCLPSLYFYGLLSGLRMSVAEVVLYTLKATAVTAMALVGILPIYAAFVLNVAVFPLPHQAVELVLLAGLALPFLAGLWGTRSLYVSFSERCGLMPAGFVTNRACFVRRLVLAWCACYTAVAPVMIITVWQNLGG